MNMGNDGQISVGLTLDDQLSSALGKTTLFLFLQKAIKQTAKFEQAMADAQSVMMTGLNQFNRMQSSILKLGGKTAITSENIAKALYDLGSAGLEAGDAMKVMNGTMKLAEATGEDLSRVAQVVTKTIRAFKLEFEDANKVSEMFATAVRSSQLRLEDISQAMVYANQVGATFNKQTLSTILASMGTLANNGMKANQSMRMLRSLLTDVSKPTAKLSRFMRKYGFELSDISAKNKNLTEILANFNKAGVSSIDIMELFGKRAQGTFEILNNNLGTMVLMEERLKSQTLLSNQLAVQTDTLIKSLGRFGTMLNSKIIKYLDGAADSIKLVTDMFTKFGSAIDISGGGLAAVQDVFTILSSIAFFQGASVLLSVGKSLLKWGGSFKALGIGATVGTIITLYRELGGKQLDALKTQTIETEKLAAEWNSIVNAMKRAKEMGDIPAFQQIQNVAREKKIAQLKERLIYLKKEREKILKKRNALEAEIGDSEIMMISPEANKKLENIISKFYDYENRIKTVTSKIEQLDKKSKDYNETVKEENELLQQIRDIYADTREGKIEALSDEINKREQMLENMKEYRAETLMSSEDVKKYSKAIQQDIVDLTDKLEKMKAPLDKEIITEFASEVKNELNVAISDFYDELKNVVDLFADATLIEQVFGGITNLTAIEKELTAVGNALNETIVAPFKEMGMGGFNFISNLIKDQRSISEKYGKKEEPGMFSGFSWGGLLGSAIGGTGGNLVSTLLSGGSIGGLVAQLGGQVLGDIIGDIFGDDDKNVVQMIARSPIGDPRKWDAYIETLESEIVSLEDIVDTNADLTDSIKSNSQAIMENTTALNESAKAQLEQFTNKDNPFWSLITELENISDEYNNIFNSNTLTQQLSDIQQQIADFYAGANFSQLVGNITGTESTLSTLDSILTGLISTHNVGNTTNWTSYYTGDEPGNLTYLKNIFSELGIAVPYTAVSDISGMGVNKSYAITDLINATTQAISSYEQELELLNEQYSLLEGQESGLVEQKETIENAILGETSALDELRSAYDAMSELFQGTVVEEFYKDFMGVFNPMQLEIDALNDKYAVYSAYITNITDLNNWYEESLRRITEEYDAQAEAIAGVSSTIEEEYLPMLLKTQTVESQPQSNLVGTLRPGDIGVVPTPSLGTTGGLFVPSLQNVASTPAGVAGTLPARSTPNVVYMNNYVTSKYDFEQAMSDAQNALDAVMGGV